MVPEQGRQQVAETTSVAGGRRPCGGGATLGRGPSSAPLAQSELGVVCKLWQTASATSAVCCLTQVQVGGDRLGGGGGGRDSTWQVQRDKSPASSLLQLVVYHPG